MICEDCGGPMEVGDYPFCHGDPTKHTRSMSGVIGDECSITQENGFAHPTRFTSKKALAQALAARGLELHVRHVSVPGTDKSPHTTDWSRGIDAYTLANATELVARQGQSKGKDVPAPDVPVTWTIAEVGDQ